MKDRLAAAAVLCALIALTFSAAEATESARSALVTCARIILPSLFPFFVLSGLLESLGLPERLGKNLSAPAERLFGVSGCGAAAMLVGLTGGYPLGAACAADLTAHGRIGREEAERLLGFCNNTGPAFLIGAVGGGVFHSASVGLLLYFSHVLAAILGGLILRKKQAGISSAPAPRIKAEPFSAAFPHAVSQAVSSVLIVCGYVVCFTVLLCLLDGRGLLSILAGHIAAACGLELHTAGALLYGFFEIGSAIARLQNAAATPENLSAAAAIIGWGGLSVHCQTAAVLSESALSLRFHCFGRLLSALLSCAIVYGVSRFLQALGILSLIL